jgi:chromate reductase, NAD(P)H dehydrogenase (quinone)
MRAAVTAAYVAKLPGVPRKGSAAARAAANPPRGMVFWRPHAASLLLKVPEETSMNQYQVGVVVGSLRRDSFNRRLANAVTKLAPEEFTLMSLEIGDLPLYNQDDDDNPAEQVKRLKREISKSAAILFVTPEYNRSMPGVLKNALDHASRPYGQSAWEGKPAGVIGTSIGAIGTAVAQQHLRNSLAYLDMPAMGQPEVFIQVQEGMFDDQGAVSGDTRDFLQGWMDKYVMWVKEHVH